MTVSQRAERILDSVLHYDRIVLGKVCREAQGFDAWQVTHQRGLRLPESSKPTFKGISKCFGANAILVLGVDIQEPVIGGSDALPLWNLLPFLFAF